METGQIHVVVNGDDMKVDVGSTVSDLIAKLDLKPERVAIEYNGSILPRSRWADLRLEAQSRLEVVHFVGGGLYVQSSSLRLLSSIWLANSKLKL
jgi:sulfur carrier protein